MLLLFLLLLLLLHKKSCWHWWHVGDPNNVHSRKDPVRGWTFIILVIMILLLLFKWRKRRMIIVVVVGKGGGMAGGPGGNSGGRVSLVGSACPLRLLQLLATRSTSSSGNSSCIAERVKENVTLKGCGIDHRIW